LRAEQSAAAFGMLVTLTPRQGDSMQLDGPTNWLWLTALFLFGLVFGSFGNVVIWRLPRGENLSHPGSHCPKCDSPIAWYDNIPLLGWLRLRGRCRNCGVEISPRYPLVELLSGVLWVSAGLRFGFTYAAGVAVFFFYVLLLLSFIDLDTMRLPNVLVGLLFGAGLVGAAISQLAGIAIVPLISQGSGALANPLVASIVGAAASAGIVLVIVLLYQLVRGTRGFGMGDIKLLAAIGVFLGLYGLMVMFIGTLLGAVYGVTAARISGVSIREKKFPFGPFLALGAVLTTLFGQSLWYWYAGLVGR
jgi:leader peptidase (prepilin peptidase)/N-methyltransferase